MTIRKAICTTRDAYRELPESRASLPELVACVADMEEQFASVLSNFSAAYYESTVRMRDSLIGPDLWTSDDLGEAGFDAAPGEPYSETRFTIQVLERLLARLKDED